MDYRVSGKPALVVGGSKGIGFEVAKMLAAEGCRVAVLARTKADVDAAVDTILPPMRDAGWGRFVHIGLATAKEPTNMPATASP